MAASGPVILMPASAASKQNRQPLRDDTYWKDYQKRISTFFKSADVLKNRLSSITDGKQELVGVNLIQVELDGHPVAVKAFSKKYSELVETVKALLEDYGVKPNDEERFIAELWGVMNRLVGITYGNNKSGFLWKSVKTGQFDCDNSAFIVFDVAKGLGVDIELVLLPNHALIKTKNFFFETTTGDHYSLDKFSNLYKTSFVITSDIEKIKSIAFINRGLACSRKGNHGLAINEFTKAIELNPAYITPYVNRGVEYLSQGDYEKAIYDFTKAIDLSPNDARMFYNRGFANFMNGNNDQTISDMNKALRLKLGPEHAHTALQFLASAHLINGARLKAAISLVRAAFSG